MSIDDLAETRTVSILDKWITKVLIEQMVGQSFVNHSRLEPGLEKSGCGLGTIYDCYLYDHPLQTETCPTIVDDDTH